MLAARRAGCVPQLQAAAASPARRHRRLQLPTRAQGSGCGSRPKAVVFDLGKVLLDFDYSISARRLAAACRADPTPAKQAALLELFGHAPVDSQQGLLDRWGGRSLVEQMERGQISGPQFHQLVCEASGEQGGRRQRAGKAGRRRARLVLASGREPAKAGRNPPLTARLPNPPPHQACNSTTPRLPSCMPTSSSQSS